MNNRIATILPLTALFLAIAFTGCTSWTVGTSVLKGRHQLLIGEPKLALTEFQRAAQLDPDYVTNFTPLEQGIWTYVGRAHYDAGNLSQARQALQKARSQHDDDFLARLYLGLTLARNGNREQGLKEIQSGIKNIYDWLEFNEQYSYYGEFWDPSRKIRSRIEGDLAMISGKEFDWAKLIASGETIGKKMEEEIDFAREDKRRELLQDGDDGGDEP